MDGEKKKKIKILFAVANMGVGGAQRIVVDQTNMIDKDFFDPYLITLNSEGKSSLFLDLRLSRKKIVFFLFSSYFNLGYWIKLIRWMKKEQFDIVFCNLILANNVVRVAAFLAGVKKIIIAEHNLYPAKKRAQFIVDRILAFITHKIFAVSYDVKNFLIERGGIPSCKVEVIYNGIDLSVFGGLKDEKYNLRKKFHFADDEVVILSVGRVIAQKAYDVLIDSAYKLKKRTQTKFRFIILGNNDSILGNELQSKVTQFNLGGVVEFWGVRRDISELMAASDIFFMPSRWEGFGIVLVEAMASGLPFVMSENGVVSVQDCKMNGIKDGIHGFVVKDYNADNFTEKLLVLVENLDLRQELGKASQLKSQDFSIARNIEQFQEICFDALK